MMQYCSLHGPFVGLACPTCTVSAATGYTTFAVQPGCICPPKSEKTCESDICPRKKRQLALEL